MDEYHLERICMKKLFKLHLVYKTLGLAFLLFSSEGAFAVDPVPGIYAGFMLGASYSTNLSLDIPNPFTTPSGTISQGVFGNIAGQLGYRIHHFRVEGELLVNNNPYNSIEFAGITVHKTGSFNYGAGQKGQATTGAFLVNGFYDFYSSNELSYFAPYVGLGIGYAYIQNKISLYYDNVLIPNTSFTETSKTPAAQLIIGAGYFLDEFTFAGLDYRYLRTQTLAYPFDSPYQLNSINLTIGGSFDRG